MSVDDKRFNCFANRSKLPCWQHGNKRPSSIDDNELRFCGVDMEREFTFYLQAEKKRKNRATPLTRFSNVEFLKDNVARLTRSLDLQWLNGSFSRKTDSTRRSMKVNGDCLRVTVFTRLVFEVIQG